MSTTKDKTNVKIDPRVAAAERFATAHDPDPNHGQQAARNSLALFDQTRELHGLGDQERLLLHAAALMHDVGYSADPARHHKESRDLILNARLEGFDPREVQIMACLARYHRKAHPDKLHRVYRDLAEEDQSIVDRLAALLRIGDGLDRTHAQSARELRIEHKKGLLRLCVRQDPPSEEDIRAAVRRATWFEEVFGIKLEIVAE